MNEKPNLALKILGWIVVVTIFIGSFFKISHFPGATLALVLSAFVYLAFYMPLWFQQALKEKKERFFIIAQFIFMCLYILSNVVKLQHWPGGRLLGNLMFYLVPLVLVPITFIKMVRSGKSSLMQFNNLVFLFYLIASTETIYIRATDSAIGISAISLSANQAEDAYAHIQAKSKYLYNAFDQLNNKEQNPFFAKAQQLKLSTDSVERYIHHLKLLIEKGIDARQDVNFDTMHMADVYGLMNTDVPTHLLAGDEKPGKPKGPELKRMIDTYRDSTLKYVNNDERVFIASGTNLSTSDADVEGEKQSWVTYNFAYLPAITVLVTLTKLQYEVKNTEAQVLTSLLNDVSKDSKDNLASKIADLGYKLEQEKSGEEIKNLQKDQELSKLRLEAKNQEMAGAKEAIIWFVVIILAFVIMAFYVIRSNVQRKKLNKQLQSQKLVIEEKNKDILDSIAYAKRLQDAILPPLSLIRQYLPESFLLYRPKDIVAGDFYWMERAGDSILIAAADCTGHGVPGAMVSVVCSNALNRTVKEFKITEPGKILDKVRELVLETFEKSQDNVQDGMDISLCCINTKTKEVQWSGAYNSLWYIPSPKGEGKGEVIEVAADKQPIGKTDNPKSFTTHTPSLAHSTFYLFTDGYADQFGGPKGKKFKYQQLKDKLSAISSLPMEEQKRILEQTLDNWKGELEQVDDILIIGIRV
jgi:serine phosphatase RsbU (regulator of sigma subunit)